MTDTDVEYCRECGETLAECGCDRCATCGRTMEGECECNN